MTEEEILGQHELVTVHIAPIEYEIAWQEFQEKQTKHRPQTYHTVQKTRAFRTNLCALAFCLKH